MQLSENPLAEGYKGSNPSALALLGDRIGVELPRLTAHSCNVISSNNLPATALTRGSLRRFNFPVGSTVHG